MRHDPVMAVDNQMASWLGLIRAEYRENPGLHLTLQQARRFWGLDDVVSSALLAALVDAGFLRQTRAGAFIRADAN